MLANTIDAGPYAGQVFDAGPWITTVHVGLDFETYSEAGCQWNEDARRWEMPDGAGGTKKGLSVVGVKNYVNHPSFDLLSLAWDMKDGHGRRRWSPWMPSSTYPQTLVDHVGRGGTISGWNAGGFEFTVWNDWCVPRYGWPVLHAWQIVDTMAKSRAHSYPGKLDNAGEVMNLRVKKDKRGDALIKKFCMPRNPTKTDPRTRITPADDPADFMNLLEYNDTDVAAEGEANLRLPDLFAGEGAVWLACHGINHRGLGVDVTAVEDCIAVLEQAQAKGNRELYTITGGAVQDSDKLPALKAWLETQGVFMPNMQAETIDLKVNELQPPAGMPKSPALRALEIRQSLGSAAVKKLYAFRHSQHKGRLYDLYQYWAARTGRWTGNGPQPQNLVKPLPQFEQFAEVEKALGVLALRNIDFVELCYPDISPLDVICSVLRSLLCAAPGNDLVCSDFSAIEGVVTAALAGCEWRLDVFRTHGMIYETSAAKIIGVPFEDFVQHRVDSGGKVLRDAVGNILSVKGGKHHPQRNKIGKFAELASGFGGWIGAWLNFGAGEYLTDDEIKQGILRWRDASPEIPELWGGQTRSWKDPRTGRWQRKEDLHGLEGAAIRAVKNPGTAYSYRYISYEVRGDVLYCRLPSGRLLTYHAPRFTPHKRFDWSPDWEGQLSYEGWNSNPQAGSLGWQRMDLYGGKLTENVVQAVARDLQANAILNVEAAGYPVVLHSHDEIASEVREGFGSVEDFESHANRLPAWAVMPDGSAWPVRMKGGWRGRRYRKD